MTNNEITESIDKLNEKIWHLEQQLYAQTTEIDKLKNQVYDLEKK